MDNDVYPYAQEARTAAAPDVLCDPFSRLDAVRTGHLASRGTLFFTVQLQQVVAVCIGNSRSEYEVRAVTTCSDVPMYCKDMF